MDDRKSEGALETIQNTGMCSSGYWFFGRPTIEELRQDLRVVWKKCRPDWNWKLRGSGVKVIAFIPRARP